MIAEIQRTPGLVQVTTAGCTLYRVPSIELLNDLLATAPGASKSLCGVKGNTTKSIESAVKRGEIHRFVAEMDGDIPEDFDSAAQWPDCEKMINDIRDQSNCGCCWAFAGAEAASDRMCIATKGKTMIPISAQDVCFNSNPDGCDGGQIDTPWQYIKDTGAVSGGQYKGTGPFGSGLCSDFSLPHCHHHGPQGKDPYPAEGKPGCPSEESPPGPTQCDATAKAPHNDFKEDKYYYKGKTQTASGEKAIQQMIVAGGPVETAFTVFSDFELYTSGIYHHVSGEMAGGHAVRMVGWGVDGGVKYWKVANSWNPYWGEKGFFRIRRGTNEGGIEDDVVGSSSDVSWTEKRLCEHGFAIQCVDQQQLNICTKPALGQPSHQSQSDREPEDVQDSSRDDCAQGSCSKGGKARESPPEVGKPSIQCGAAGKVQLERDSQGISGHAGHDTNGRPLERRGWVTLASLASVFFGFDNFFVAYAGNVFKPVEYMAAMLLMVGVISALGSLLLATFCESFRKETASCSRQASPLKLFWFLSSGAFIALAQTCGCLSFSLDEVNSGPHQAVVVANVPLVGMFFYVYSGETLSRQQLFGCFLIMAGVLYMSGFFSLSRPAREEPAQFRSFLWICMSCMFYAASIITIRLAGEADLPSRPKSAAIVFSSGILGPRHSCEETLL
ncbi:CTSB [Symbiodinium sp. CCMP2592]|nr:CTSB [Symbiodinium sp. CCMP2592]